MNSITLWHHLYQDSVLRRARDPNKTGMTKISRKEICMNENFARVVDPPKRKKKKKCINQHWGTGSGRSNVCPTPLCNQEKGQDRSLNIKIWQPRSSQYQRLYAWCSYKLIGLQRPWLPILQPRVIFSPKRYLYLQTKLTTVTRILIDINTDHCSKRSFLTQLHFS